MFAPSPSMMRIALLVVCFASVASADPTESHLAVSGHMGLFGPLGMLGVEAEYSPLPWVSVAGGVGTNRGFTAQFGGASSGSFAAAIRGRYPIAARWAV